MERTAMTNNLKTTSGEIILPEYEEAAKEILSRFAITPTDEAIVAAAEPFVEVIVGQEETETKYFSTRGV